MLACSTGRRRSARRGEGAELSSQARPQRLRFRHNVTRSIPRSSAASSNVQDCPSTRCTTLARRPRATPRTRRCAERRAAGPPNDAEAGPPPAPLLVSAARRVNRRPSPLPVLLPSSGFRPGNPAGRRPATFEAVNVCPAVAHARPFQLLCSRAHRQPPARTRFAARLATAVPSLLTLEPDSYEG